MKLKIEIECAEPDDASSLTMPEITRTVAEFLQAMERLSIDAVVRNSPWPLIGVRVDRQVGTATLTRSKT